MTDKVFITQQNIIEIIVEGDQTVESVRQLGNAASLLGDQMRDAGRPVIILDNLSQIGKVPPEARQLVVDFIKHVEYDRLAMVGSNPLVRFGANLMFQASGKRNRLKFFESRHAAVEWLLMIGPDMQQ